LAASTDGQSSKRNAASPERLRRGFRAIPVDPSGQIVQPWLQIRAAPPISTSLDQPPCTVDDSTRRLQFGVRYSFQVDGDAAFGVRRPASGAMRRACAALIVGLFTLLAGGAIACRQPVVVPAPPQQAISREDDAFLEDLSRRTFMFFWEQADPATGIVRDRSRTDGGPANEQAKNIGSIASVGFGLSGMCIAAERGWLPRAQVVDRTRTTLRFFGERMPQEHGWFFHFVNLQTGAREWQSELSSIDSALLLAGVLTVRQCFAGDPEIARLADGIYRRVDFQWMLAGDSAVLAHGWKPESGFLSGRWDHYCELMILYLLGIGSPTHAIPAASWTAWSRPTMTFERFSYVSGADLFVHQYRRRGGLRGRRGRSPASTVREFPIATRGTRPSASACRGVSGYSDNVWGSQRRTARRATSRGAVHRGMRSTAAWSPRPPRVADVRAGDHRPALRRMQRTSAINLQPYGFADAFHPASWVNPDVIGIDRDRFAERREPSQRARLDVVHGGRITDALVEAGSPCLVFSLPFPAGLLTIDSGPARPRRGRREVTTCIRSVIGASYRQLSGPLVSGLNAA
jgi:hypothetical protein